MERTSTKHGPRTDDALRHETESLTRGSPVESRAEESRMAEPPGDDDFLSSAVLHSLDPPIMGMPADEVAARSMLAIGLRPGAFPADAPSLLRDAVANKAPEWVCATLRGVDQVQRYDNVQQLWEATGGHHELRTLRHESVAVDLAQGEHEDAPVLKRARRAVTGEMAQAAPTVTEVVDDKRAARSRRELSGCGARVRGCELETRHAHDRTRGHARHAPAAAPRLITRAPACTRCRGVRARA